MTENLPEVQAPQSLMEIAIKNNASLDKIDKMMELQMKWEENEAKKAYVVAMSDFKKNPPVIIKDQSVSFGQGKTSYKHASLANVADKVGKALAEHSLSASWSTSQADGLITVKCTITHSQGYGESTSISASPDTTGSKNGIQAIGSTITYLERYSILALTGLATNEHEDDGNASGSPPQCITAEQVSELTDLINSQSAPESDWLTWAAVESLETMPENKYNKLKTALEAAAK